MLRSMFTISSDDEPPIFILRLPFTMIRRTLTLGARRFGERIGRVLQNRRLAVNDFSGRFHTLLSIPMPPPSLFFFDFLSVRCEG